MNYYRAIFISDLHLGTRGCSADHILDFLRENSSETLYLNGDIIDGWQLKRRFYWPQTHNDVLQKILRKARNGTRVVWVMGNHDDFLRPYLGQSFGGIEITEEAIHMTADGRRLLVLHGDRFDAVTHYHTWIAKIADNCYDGIIVADRWLITLRKWLGYRPWSLSAYAKRRVKKAVCFIYNYEQTLAGECRKRGFDAIVCGHIHTAEIRMIDDVLYCNTGDWVASCTALVEDFDGRLSIISTWDVAA